MKYRIAANILQASGTQFFLVEAESKIDAIEKWQQGDAEFEGEEIEVDVLDDITEDQVSLVG